MTGQRVLIVGGGVSGLATAYYLGKLGIRSVLVEKSKRLGGLIRTDLVEGCRLEGGPDSYIATKPAATELAGELGELGQQVIGSNDRARRIFIVRGGKLVPFPQGMSMMVPGKWRPLLASNLFSAGAKMRFLTETLRTPRQRLDDISVGEFVMDHFGREVLESVTEPLLSGVYGGHAAELSAQSVLPRFLNYEQKYGSLVKGVRNEQSEGHKGSLFLSFRDGMQSLTDTLAAAISPHTERVTGKALAVSRSELCWRTKIGEDQLDTQQVVLACPAYVSGELLQKSYPEISTELQAIPYSSAILVSLLYPAASFAHPLNGFGFLVPQSERRTIAAATWINTKFPTRVAPGLIAIRVFIVADEATALLDAGDAELIDLVKADLARLIGIRTAAKHYGVDRWPASMPQYIVGHAARQQRISSLLTGIPSLHLAGNAYDGVGIPDCVRRAKEIAARIGGIKSC